jgi:catechol 2,3-dioxygenase-like lactoylglutathione lyase family enzyme
MEIDHLTVPVRDYEVAKRFYADALEPLGFTVLLDWHDRRRAYLGVRSRRARCGSSSRRSPGRSTSRSQSQTAAP